MPQRLEWRRWVVGEAEREIQLLPVMPDRPVVVRPDVALEILPNREALFFVSVPAWVRVVARDPSPQTLCEEQPVVLSNIWFGDPAFGELCYSVQTRARRSIAEADARPHRAICPVLVRNGSTDLLDCQRLCIRVQHLKTFDGHVQPWTNQVNVTFRGYDQESRIEYLGTPPARQEVGGLLSEARSPLTHSMIKKSFSRLKFFTGV